MKKILWIAFISPVFMLASCSSSDCRRCTKTISGQNYEATACKNGQIITCGSYNSETLCDTTQGPEQTDASLDAWVNAQTGQGWSCD